MAFVWPVEEKEEAEEPEIDSELIEEAACKVLEVIFEELMDVNKVVSKLRSKGAHVVSPLQ